MNKKTSYYSGIETKAAPIVSSKDVFHKYASVAEIFTLAQWESVVLHYKKGFTSKESGKLLGIAPRSVRSRLQRAKIVLLDYQKELRSEQFRLLRSEIDLD